MHGVREGTRVDEFLRIDARRRRAGDIANIVGAGALAPQPGVLHAFDDLDGVLGLDFADLNIGARRQIQIAAAVGFRQIGERDELPMGKRAIWDAQPTHIRVLCWCDIEQAVIPPAKIVLRFGRLIAARLRDKARIGVERMFLPFPFLLIAKLAATGRDTVLRREMSGVRTNGHDASASWSGRAEARGEAFEIAFLIEREVSRHGYAAFLGSARSPNISSSRNGPTSTPPRIRSR